jgi:hypothetical protein
MVADRRRGASVPPAGANRGECASRRGVRWSVVPAAKRAHSRGQSFTGDVGAHRSGGAARRSVRRPHHAGARVADEAGVGGLEPGRTRRQPGAGQRGSGHVPSRADLAGADARGTSAPGSGDARGGGSVDDRATRGGAQARGTRASGAPGGGDRAGPRSDGDQETQRCEGPDGARVDDRRRGSRDEDGRWRVPPGVQRAVRDHDRRLGSSWA